MIKIITFWFTSQVSYNEANSSKDWYNYASTLSQGDGFFMVGLF